MSHLGLGFGVNVVVKGQSHPQVLCRGGLVQGAHLPASPPTAGGDEQMFSSCLVPLPSVLQALIWLSISLLSN